jgi:RFX DNA-binding domain
MHARRRPIGSDLGGAGTRHIERDAGVTSNSATFSASSISAMAIASLSAARDPSQWVCRSRSMARPVATFVREKCKVGDPQFHSVKRADLYKAWRDWCTEQGRDHPGSAATFGKRLRVVVPSVTSRRPREPGSPDVNVDDRRPRYYYGVSLG